MKLQSVRPVELFAFSEHNGGDKRYNSGRNRRNRAGSNANGRFIINTRIESQPISLAHALNLLSNVSIVRHIGFDLAKHYTNSGYTGLWPEDWSAPEYDKWLAEKLQFNQDTDIIVPSPFSGDEILTNPVKWINDNLTKLGYKDEA